VGCQDARMLVDYVSLADPDYIIVYDLAHTSFSTIKLG
jgi:hypothetical protein